MVVAPRVGALALVLQNAEDGGFLYVRHDETRSAMDDDDDTGDANLGEDA